MKEVTAAYDLLGDTDRQARFDPGEIDASGAERSRHRYFLSELFRRSGSGGHGADVRYSLAIDFVDAVNGATKRLTLLDGAVLDITIPLGTREGQVLRLRGKGRPGHVGEP